MAQFECFHHRKVGKHSEVGRISKIFLQLFGFEKVRVYDFAHMSTSGNEENRSEWTMTDLGKGVRAGRRRRKGRCLVLPSAGDLPRVPNTARLSTTTQNRRSVFKKLPRVKSRLNGDFSLGQFRSVLKID